MNRYELTYIIDTGLEETVRKELIEKFSGIIRQNGGEVEKVDETWGKRRLAYPINDMLEGYYVMVTFQSEGDLPREVERNLEINESILRYLIIKQVEKKHSVKPRPIRAAAPAVPPPDEESPAELSETERTTPVTEDIASTQDAAAETPIAEDTPAVEDSPMAEDSTVTEEPAVVDPSADLAADAAVAQVLPETSAE